MITAPSRARRVGSVAIPTSVAAAVATVAAACVSTATVRRAVTLCESTTASTLTADSGAFTVGAAAAAVATTSDMCYIAVRGVVGLPVECLGLVCISLHAAAVVYACGEITASTSCTSIVECDSAFLCDSALCLPLPLRELLLRLWIPWRMLLLGRRQSVLFFLLLLLLKL